jgi:hypothetical protein
MLGASVRQAWSFGGGRLSMDSTWRRIAADSPPRWFGDLNDDCTARWAGFTLRVECMNEDDWWWAVFDDASDLEVASSDREPDRCLSGAQARASAEHAVRSYLGIGSRS